MQETQVQSLGGEDTLEKGKVTPQVVLPGKSHGQRNLVGYSPWSHKELDTTEGLHFSFFSLSSVQSLSRVQLFVTTRTAAHQASRSITNSLSLLKLMSIESVRPS